MPYYNFNDLLVAASRHPGESVDSKPHAVIHPVRKERPIIDLQTRQVFQIPWTSIKADDSANMDLRFFPTVPGNLPQMNNILDVHENSGTVIDYSGVIIPATGTVFPDTEDFFNTYWTNPALAQVQNITDTGTGLVIKTNRQEIYETSPFNIWGIWGPYGYDWETIENISYWSACDYVITAWLPCGISSNSATGIISVSVDENTGILTCIAERTIAATGLPTGLWKKTLDFSAILDYGKTLTPAAHEPPITGTFADFTFEIRATSLSPNGYPHLIYDPAVDFSMPFSESYTGMMTAGQIWAPTEPSLQLFITLPWYIIDRRGWPRKPDIRESVTVNTYEIPYQETNHDPGSAYDAQALAGYGPNISDTYTFFTYNLRDFEKLPWLNEGYIMTYAGATFPNEPANPSFFDTKKYIISVPEIINHVVSGAPSLFYNGEPWDMYLNASAWIGNSDTSPTVSVTLTCTISDTDITVSASSNNPGHSGTVTWTHDFSSMISNFNNFEALCVYTTAPSGIGTNTNIEQSFSYTSNDFNPPGLAVPSFTVYLRFPSSIIYRS